MVQQKSQDDVFREMTPERKLMLSAELYYAARELKAAWLRQIHNDWPEEKIQEEVREIFTNART